MIDYWISPNAIDAPVTLDIFDSTGSHLIRHFSSLDQARAGESQRAQRSYVLGASVANLVSRPRNASLRLGSAPILRPMCWSTNIPSRPSITTRRAIRSERPSLPGNYKLVLTAGRQTYSQTLTIRMDPRVKVSSTDLDRHFELDRKIADALHRDYEALQQVRSVRAQLKSLTSARDAIKKDVTRKAVADLEAKAASIEGEEGGYGARYLSTPDGRSLARLNSGLGTLVSALDTADAAPTTQQAAMFVELNKALEEQLSAWGQLKSKDIPALNEQLKKAGLPGIDLQKPVPGARRCGSDNFAGQGPERGIEGSGVARALLSALRGLKSGTT